MAGWIKEGESMALWQAHTFTLVGVLIVLLQVTVIALSTSKLAPKERTAVWMLCGTALFLLAVIAPDVADIVPNRLVIDFALFIGGLVAGMFGGAFLRVRPLFHRSGTPTIQ